MGSLPTSDGIAHDRNTLPQLVTPLNYSLSIFDIEAEDWSYAGTVTIDLTILQSTQEIVLNAHYLSIDGASIILQDSEKPFSASSITQSAGLQRVTFFFPVLLIPSTQCQLKVRFRGNINDLMVGFYRSRYFSSSPTPDSVPKENGRSCMLSTQFEPCYARRAFPCFDEPSFKATFDFEVEVPEDLSALSNMPVQETAPGVRSGYKVVRFEKTVKMSTYLLAWAIGDFEYIEGETLHEHCGTKVPLRVYTTRGLKSTAEFGLNFAIACLDYFADILGIDYTLPKLDMVAVHEVANSAMENWGLMTFSTTTLLHDEATSDLRFKNRVAYIIAHEVAHQWFGNLVTMEWWNEVWLNEGFATWAGWMAVDHLFPEWDVWTQFAISSKQTAFDMDCLCASHAVITHVSDAYDIKQVFDYMSYLKGGSLLRMLSKMITEEKFLKGLNLYLGRHEYGTATSSDLFNALREASGVDVAGFMHPWLHKKGYPSISISDDGVVKQKRLAWSADELKEDEYNNWEVPVRIKSIQGHKTLYYLQNHELSGFYRILYCKEQLDCIVSHGSTSDIIVAAGDTAALAMTGKLPTTVFLDLLLKIKFRPDYFLWSQVIQSLSTIRSLFSDINDIADGLKNFTSDVIQDHVNQIDWKSTPMDTFLSRQLKGLLINAAGHTGHCPTVTKAESLANDFFTSNSVAFDPTLRLPIFSIALSNGGKGVYDRVINYYRTTTDIDGRDIALSALGGVQDPSILTEYLCFVLDRDNVSLEDMKTCMTALGANSTARRVLWPTLKGSFEMWYNRIKREPALVERYLRGALGGYADEHIAEDVLSFFAGMNTKGFDQMLAVVVEGIKKNAAYRERDEDCIRKWLVENGYIKSSNCI